MPLSISSPDNPLADPGGLVVVVADALFPFGKVVVIVGGVVLVVCPG
jgi:hypothetical protein